MIGAAGYQSDRAAEVIIGVDTHKDQHVTVAIDGRGVRLGENHVPATTCGYEELERWSRSLGAIHSFGVEGTGSYGAGVARFLTGRGYTVIEVNRPDRSVRYRKGKSDPTDAEMAARGVLAGVADATPKSGEGEVEMIRMLKSARDSAVKARTQAGNQMKALVVTAPAELREMLDGLTTSALAKRCRTFRPSRPDDPRTAAKYALRSLACRYRQLSEEVRDHLSSRAPKFSHPRRVGSSYLLSGLAKCKRCNTPLIGRFAQSGKYSYYVCQSNISSAGTPARLPRSTPAASRSWWSPRLIPS